MVTIKGIQYIEFRNFLMPSDIWHCIVFPNHPQSSTTGIYAELDSLPDKETFIEKVYQPICQNLITKIQSNNGLDSDKVVESRYFVLAYRDHQPYTNPLWKQPIHSLNCSESIEAFKDAVTYYQNLILSNEDYFKTL